MFCNYLCSRRDLSASDLHSGKFPEQSSKTSFCWKTGVLKGQSTKNSITRSRSFYSLRLLLVYISTICCHKEIGKVFKQPVIFLRQIKKWRLNRQSSSNFVLLFKYQKISRIHIKVILTNLEELT